MAPLAWILRKMSEPVCRPLDRAESTSGILVLLWCGFRMRAVLMTPSGALLRQSSASPGAESPGERRSETPGSGASELSCSDFSGNESKQLLRFLVYGIMRKSFPVEMCRTEERTDPAVAVPGSFRAAGRNGPVRERTVQRRISGGESSEDCRREMGGYG